MKRKQKDQKFISVDKKIIKNKEKDKNSVKELFSNRLNFKKIHSLKYIRPKENKSNVSSIIKIKKVNGHNKSSSGNKIISKKINSGNKTTIINKKNPKFLINNIINSGNLLINSYINYSKLQNNNEKKKL